MTIHVIWGNNLKHTQVKSWRNATNVIMPRSNRIWSESMTHPLTSLPTHSINSLTDRGNCKKWSWVITPFFFWKHCQKFRNPTTTKPHLHYQLIFHLCKNQTFAVADPSFRVIQLYSLFKSWLVHLTTLCFPVLLLHFHIQFTLSPSLHLLPRHQLWKSESML